MAPRPCATAIEQRDSTKVLIKPLCSEGDDTELGIIVAAQAKSGVDTESGSDVEAHARRRPNQCSLRRHARAEPRDRSVLPLVDRQDVLFSLLRQVGAVSAMMVIVAATPATRDATLKCKDGAAIPPWLEDGAAVKVCVPLTREVSQGLVGAVKISGRDLAGGQLEKLSTGAHLAASGLARRLGDEGVPAGRQRRKSIRVLEMRVVHATITLQKTAPRQLFAHDNVLNPISKVPALMVNIQTALNVHPIGMQYCVIQGSGGLRLQGVQGEAEFLHLCLWEPHIEGLQNNLTFQGNRGIFSFTSLAGKEIQVTSSC